MKLSVNDFRPGKAIAFSRLGGIGDFRALKSRRKLWLSVHLYLGLIAGAILAIVGLSGSIAVFFVELQEVLNPELAVISVLKKHPKQARPLGEIIKSAEAVKPQGSHFFKVYYPRKADVAYKLLYFIHNANQTNNGDGYYIFVDPYTMQVKGLQLWHPKDQYWGRPVMSFIMQLHWCLLFGKTGGIINGVFAALSIISVLTGLIVWWPLTGKFKQALTFKRRASGARFNFDLHKTIGFYSAIVLLPVLFSGIYMNLPDQVNTLVKLFSPITRPDAFTAIPTTIHSNLPRSERQTINIAEVETIIQKNYPAGDFWMLNAPKDQTDVYRVVKKNVMEVSRFVGYRDFAIDQYSGDILDVYDRGSSSFGNTFLDWQWSIHSGHAFGWFGRSLVFISGLACFVLYVTGVIRWMQKRRAKKILPVVNR